MGGKQGLEFLVNWEIHSLREALEMLKLCDIQIYKVQVENERPFQGRVTVPSWYKSDLPEQGSRDY